MSEQSQTPPEGTESQTIEPAQATQQATTGTETQTTKTGSEQSQSLLNKDETKAPEAAKAPDKYADFKLPDGMKLDPTTLADASTLFKSLNLDQAGAQSLVDFHTKALAKAASDPVDAWSGMVKDWGDKSAADPDIGPKMAQIKETVGRAYDALISAAGDKAPAMRATVAEFKSIMDLTGAGNHPAFIKVLSGLASALVEGKHVAGSAPSTFGQGEQGARPSAAQALYGKPAS